MSLMRELFTEIEIQAPADKVWRILTDLSRFAEWNPFIRKAQGEVKKGARLHVHIVPPNSKGMTFKPSVTRVVQGWEFRWLGRLILPGLFDGEHIFEIVPIDNTAVRFIQREKFRGVLVPIFWRNLDTHTRQGFNEMNKALKKRAEIYT